LIGAGREGKAGSPKGLAIQSGQRHLCNSRKESGYTGSAGDEMTDREGMRVGKVTGRSQTVSPVKGGWIKREVESGRFVEVQSENGTFRASRTSEVAVELASRKRREGLKRLSDR
jgi:hypothetical protein